MVKLADKIDKLMEDYDNYKDPPKKELIAKQIIP
jgi:hypothetical protein